MEENQWVTTINGGDNRGTYVKKELVYHYSMWVSAKFMGIVINTFDKLLVSEYAFKMQHNQALMQQNERLILENKDKLEELARTNSRLEAENSVLKAKEAGFNTAVGLQNQHISKLERENVEASKLKKEVNRLKDWIIERAMKGN